jgi:hypothetical protein
MAISFLQITELSSTSNAATSATLNFSSTTSAGSVVVVCALPNIGVNAGALPTSFTFSNSKGDAFTDSGLGFLNSAGWATNVQTVAQIGAFLTCTTGANAFKVAFNGGTPGGYTIWAYEIAGLTSAKFDKFVSATATASAFSSGSTGTLSTAAEAAIGIGASDASATATGSGWTGGQGSTVGSNTGDGANIDLIGTLAEHQVTAATTAITATGTSTAAHTATLCVTLQSGSAGLLLPGVQSFDLAHPVNLRDRNAFPNDLRTFFDRTHILLIGKDVQFGAAGQWKTYDYPNPLGSSRAYQNDQRTFIHSSQVQLIGKDVQFGTAGQWKTYDYPNPLGSRRAYPYDLRTWAYTYSPALVLPYGQKIYDLARGQIYQNDLRTFINPSKFQLVGKDIQFGAAGQWKTYDYPNPLGSSRPYPSDLRTWSYTYPPALTFPYGKSIYDLARGQIYQNDLRTLAVNLQQNTLSIISTPFAQTDWPLPRSYSRPDETWVYFYTPSFSLTGASPAGSLSYDRPILTTYQNDLRTWAYTYEPALTFPYGQSIYDLSRGQIYQNDLRTWAYIFSASLVPSQPPFGGIYDRAAISTYQNDLRTWVYFYAPSFSLTGAAPAGQFSYDLSSGRSSYQNDLRTWAYNYNPGLTAPIGGSLYDRLSISSYQGDLRTWAYIYPPSLSAATPFVGFVYDLTIRPTYSNDLRTWAYTYAPGLLSPVQPQFGGAIYDLPLRPAYPPDLLTWFQGNSSFIYYAPASPPFIPIDWSIPYTLQIRGDVYAFTNVPLLSQQPLPPPVAPPVPTQTGVRPPIRFIDPWYENEFVPVWLLMDN